MSYIRYGQDGQYVDIPDGSKTYIYDNGSDISGWSYEQFAALIGQVAYKIDIENSKATTIKNEFRKHFNGWNPDYKGGIFPPERAEIFCQCVDSRIDRLTLTNQLQEKAQQWANEFDAMRECEYCGTMIRPQHYNNTTKYVCEQKHCELRAEAEKYGLTLEQAIEANNFDDLHDKWEYINEKSDKTDPQYVR